MSDQPRVFNLTVDQRALIHNGLKDLDRRTHTRNELPADVVALFDSILDAPLATATFCGECPYFEQPGVTACDINNNCNCVPC